ncbi:MAG: GNAT family protein [Polyangiaceae bacterium]
MRIAAGSCVLRPFEPEDAPRLAALADDERVWINVRDSFPRPYTQEDARGFIAYALSADPTTQLAIDVGGVVAGCIGADGRDDVERRTVELGYWLGQPYWGRGIATAAVRAFVPWIWETLDVLRIEACVFSFNPASARVLEKSGFTLEGRLKHAVFKSGIVADRLVYGLVR